MTHAQLLRPVIVGYGRAGRDLHHRSLRTLAERGTLRTGEVIVVDPRHPADLLPGTTWFPTPGGAFDHLTDPTLGVFHITAPAGTHIPLATQLLDLGARCLVLEKPIAGSHSEARQLAAQAARRGAQLIPVSVWPASQITRQVTELLTAGRIGTPQMLYMEQSKPRFRRTITDRGHRNALEIELPHQVVLALYLGGEVTEITEVRTWSMPLPTKTLAAMGGVRLVLRHRSGATSTLVSDLTSSIRIRRLRITGTSGELRADFPISSEDDFGQLRVTGEPGRRVVQDAPLTRFLELVYAHLDGTLERPPPCGLDIHLRAVELVEAATLAVHGKEDLTC
ncbi:hypothetical protein GCM10012275_58970 [Longimycelium tulufanense]|uniref:Gfo/Idh/MocA-like oxidoreductase N-terminal domain-containing protein n=1 Tax=Longimycelium tulufanense TaxID=907463 RepID=A0A8J3CE67_9PSEU|nr:Gfo/Idh/MocA family oxidoreductase [Longimycelium tulufanense]GGM80537.1 hypothetical protein GCM10012275_58970 [Longimycelium tulufanense]